MKEKTNNRDNAKQRNYFPRQAKQVTDINTLNDDGSAIVMTAKVPSPPRLFVKTRPGLGLYLSLFSPVEQKENTHADCGTLCQYCFSAFFALVIVYWY
jgi:hypothetical protein